MHAGNDNNRLGVNSIVQGVWEPLEESPPSISVNHDTNFWIGGYCLHARSNGRYELRAQPDALNLIPAKRIFHIGCRSRSEDDFRHSVRP